MPISCPQCKARLPENAAFCPFCGLRIFVATPGQTVALKDRLAGALAYVTIFPAIAFLLIAGFKRNRFVRFHSLQCIFLALAGLVVAGAMKLVFSLLSLLPRVGFLLAWLAVSLAVLGWVILWIVLMLKALQGECFKLPLIGNLVEKM